MVSVGDPVAAGLVATLGRPGGNVTGFSNLSVELNTKRLEILKDAIPRTGRVGLVSAAGGGLSSDLQPKELGPAAAVEGSRPVNSVEYSKRKSAGGFTEAAIHSLKGKALAKQKFALSFLAAEDATRIESPCLGMIRRRRGRANTQR